MTASQKFHNINKVFFGSSVIESELVAGFASVTVSSKGAASKVAKTLSKRFGVAKIIADASRPSRPASVKTREERRAWILNTSEVLNGNYTVVFNVGKK
jgi:hypothetical protein